VAITVSNTIRHPTGAVKSTKPDHLRSWAWDS